MRQIYGLSRGLIFGTKEGGEEAMYTNTPTYTIEPRHSLPEEVPRDETILRVERELRFQTI